MKKVKMNLDSVVSTDGNSLNKIKLYISQQITKLKTECEEIFDVLSFSKEFTERQNTLRAQTESWKSQAFLEWLGYIDSGLFTDDVSQLERQTATALQNRSFMYERLSTRVNSINVCQNGKNRIHALVGKIVASLDEMTVKKMIVSYMRVLGQNK